MKIVTNTNEIRKILRTKLQKIALVPTMGNLHAGHLELVRKAEEFAEVVVVSIFVNPLQFGPNEDFSIYPRTFQEDIEKLKSFKVAILFAPDMEEIYPNLENQTQVRVPKIADEFCGRFRPGFFDGVTTMVTKLFNIVQPDVAVFGEKDFQQLHIVKKLVLDLSFPIEIISVPTVRESDGLAMSSRNQYLSQEERKVACEINKTLNAMRTTLLAGNKDHLEIINNAKDFLQKNNFKVDYINICNRNNLSPSTDAHKELIILVAVRLGNTRLIDNLFVNLQ